MKEIEIINKECVGNRILITRLLFLRGLALIYLIAFISLYGQIQGIWGNDGIIPANLFLSRLKENLKGYQHLIFYPTIAWLLNLNTQSYAIENLLFILCLLGVIISLLIFLNNNYLLNSFGFLILWYIFYNFILLGQAFMKLSWDGLLSEIGFITIFFAPFNFRYINYITHINNMAFYILKFILLKFMISTGINLVGSQCPYWTSFTGLNFFFHGQPILTPLSYFLHFSVSDILKKVINAFVFFCLLYLPIGYFLIWRRFSIYTGQITFIFNFFLIFVGNYGYLHLLIIILNTLNFDDFFYRSVINRKIINYFSLDYLSPLIPLYIEDKKKKNDLISQKETKFNEIKNKLEKENEKKELEKDKEKIKNLEKEYNQVRKEIYDLVDDEFSDGPRIETSLKIDSNLLKECFIFINFFCANILLVYLVLYPIKRLIQGATALEDLPKKKFKTIIIIVSIYVFIYIIFSILINLSNKVKNSILSEKSIMASVMTQMIEEKRNKEKNADGEKKGEKNENYNDDKKIKTKIPKLKIILYSFVWLFKISKYFLIIIFLTIYFFGSIKYFLINLNIEMFEEKVRNSKIANDIEKQNYGTYKTLVLFSDIMFGNYFIYGTYGNIQEEILNVNGRSEIEIEYTSKLNPSSWKTVNFQYKLGPNNSIPKFLFFYLPRLDWKIFEAAREEDLNEDSWIVLLLGKIFEKNPVVLDLLGYEIEQKEILYKSSFFEKMKELYLGRTKYELLSEPEKIKIDIFKYQYIKPNEIKNKKEIFKRKRYKEYLSQIEKYAIYLVYEKLGLPKPDINKQARINKFQLIPLVDLIAIFILINPLLSKKFK